jgi:hypothetical protein
MWLSLGKFPVKIVDIYPDNTFNGFPQLIRIHETSCNCFYPSHFHFIIMNPLLHLAPTASAADTVSLITSPLTSMLTFSGTNRQSGFCRGKL